MAAWNRPKYGIFVLLSTASTKFRKILQKYRNSAETGKFRDSAQNSVSRRKLWSLRIVIIIVIITITSLLLLVYRATW